MDNSTSQIRDYEAIERVLLHYIKGAQTGKGDDMKPAFHEEATVFGYVGPDLLAGPIQKLFAWNDDNGPATDVDYGIGSFEVTGTVASVRLELENWTGFRFTDLFTLLKVDGDWKIMNKVFHVHADAGN